MPEDNRQLVQFRISKELREFLKTADQRNPQIRNMRQYLVFLASKDGYKPTAYDL